MDSTRKIVQHGLKNIVSTHQVTLAPPSAYYRDRSNGLNESPTEKEPYFKKNSEEDHIYPGDLHRMNRIIQHVGLASRLPCVVQLDGTVRQMIRL